MKVKGDPRAGSRHSLQSAQGKPNTSRIFYSLPQPEPGALAK
jgi:hypothetical protein